MTTMVKHWCDAEKSLMEIDASQPCNWCGKTEKVMIIETAQVCHQIVEMQWQEAYPAASGRYCTVCGERELDWGVFTPKRIPLRDKSCPGKSGSARS